MGLRNNLVLPTQDVLNVVSSVKSVKFEIAIPATWYIFVASMYENAYYQTCCMKFLGALYEITWDHGCRRCGKLTALLTRNYI